MAPAPSSTSSSMSSAPSASSSTMDPHPSEESGQALNAGARAMIAIGAILGAVILFTTIIVLFRRAQFRRRSAKELQQENTYTPEKRREIVERRNRHIEEQQEAQEKALSSASSMISDRRPSDPFATPASQVTPCASPPSNLKPLAVNVDSPFKQEFVVGEMERASQEVLTDNNASLSGGASPPPSLFSERRPSDTSTLCQDPSDYKTEDKVEEVDTVAPPAPKPEA